MIAHAMLALGGAVMLAPFLWMLLTSLRPASGVFGGFSLAALEGFGNYAYALETAPLLRFMLNGVIVCAGILVVQLLVAIPCAYALAKLPFRGRGAMFGLVLAALCIPIQVPALPLYLGLAHVGLLDTYLAMMLPFFLSVFAIFLFRQFFKSFPDEIIQAARLDGAGEFEIVWRFVAPSALPAIAAFSIFSVVAHWNDLYWPLIVITETRLAPPPLGMLYFRDVETGSNYGALMAGATIITAPLVIAFLVARRRFIQGVTMTGLK
ncbi:carbohydrate ABC transporter permease [Elioraea rosea]|uniref:carbohydrate ABC transporter permease n=1 Tax=Elioraea rosea TaxID=2492390 RepID=UPI00195121C0|nr:carbohydrate ABC transporter permease [Elioraea rosea]